MGGLAVVFIFGAFLFNFAIAAPASLTLAVEELASPTINVSPDIYYPLDEILFIEGRSTPTATVQIEFRKSGARPVNLNTKSDADGAWAFAQKVPLEAGDWEIRARIAENSGKFSSWSNPRVIKAISTGLVIGGITIKYAPVAAFIAFALLASIALLMYSFFKMRIAKRMEEEREMQGRAALFEKTLRDKEREFEKEKEMRTKTEELERELREKEMEIAKIAVTQKFSDIKHSVADEMEHLEKKLADGGGLSKEEGEHQDRLLCQLREAEDEIERKLK